MNNAQIKVQALLMIGKNMSHMKHICQCLSDKHVDRLTQQFMSSKQKHSTCLLPLLIQLDAGAKACGSEHMTLAVLPWRNTARWVQCNSGWHPKVLFAV